MPVPPERNLSIIYPGRDVNISRFPRFIDQCDIFTPNLAFSCIIRSWKFHLSTKEFALLKSHQFWVVGILVCFIFTLCFPLFTQGGPSAQKTFATLPYFPCYRTLETVYADAENLANAHPNLAHWLDIGDSWVKQNSGGASGYDINILKLTNQDTDGDKPVLFVMSALHARDLAPVELNLRFAEQLLSGYGNDPEITWLLDEVEIHLLLVANPDGRAVVEQQIANGNPGAGGVYARMKNLNAVTCSDSDYTGTDLRRNFSLEWEGVYSGCLNEYSGTSALSEPESSSIQAYFDDVFPDYRDGDPFDIAEVSGLLLNIESYGDIFRYPYFYTYNDAPEETALYTLANKLAYDLAAYPNNPSALLHGAPEDYVYAELGIPALAYAMGNKYNGKYFMYCSEFEGTLATNLEMLTRAAKAAFSPYILPAGPEVTNISLQSHEENGQAVWQLSASAKTNLYRLPSQPSPIVAAAAYSIDSAPWKEGAETLPLQAADGNWDKDEEALVATLDVSNLQPGQHRVYVQAALSDGTVGLPSAGTFTVTDEPLPTPPPTGYMLYLPLINK